MQYEDVKTSDWIRTALHVATGVLIIVAGAVFLLDVSRVVGGRLLLVLAGVVIATLVTWRAKTFAYRCTKCGEGFSISPGLPEPSGHRHERRMEVPHVPALSYA